MKTERVNEFMDNEGKNSTTIFSPALITILGMLGAAIAPSVGFVNGYWQNKLKEKEIAHQIALDFAKLAITENASREYRRDTLNVIASIPENPLQEWATKTLKENLEEEPAVMQALLARVNGPDYNTFSECDKFLAIQIRTTYIALKEIYGREDIGETVRRARKDDFTLRVEKDCRELKEKESGVIAKPSPIENVSCPGKIKNPKDLDEQTLSQIFSKASSEKIKTFLPLFQKGMQKHNVNTCLRMAMFLAQVGFESDELRYSEEIGGAAYEGRRDLGNTQPGDGKRFKGRGFIQITGRANYKTFADYTGRPEVFKTPNIVASDPFFTLEAAFFFWERFGLNALADKGDVRKATKKINGGYNGLDARMTLYSTAISLL